MQEIRGGNNLGTQMNKLEKMGSLENKASHHLIYCRRWDLNNRPSSEMPIERRFSER